MTQSTEPRTRPAVGGMGGGLLDAIVLAGGDPACDAELLRYAGGAPCKALIPVGGRSMLEHVLAALLQSGYVRRVVVAGLPSSRDVALQRLYPAPDVAWVPDAGLPSGRDVAGLPSGRDVAGLPSGRDVALQRLYMGAGVAWVPDAGGILENGQAGFDYLCAHGGASERVVLSTADLPLLTPDIIRSLLDMFLSAEADFCYPIIPQQVMERALPGSGRTFVRLREGRFAGGDVHLVRPAVLDAGRSAINELLSGRKAFWRQVQMVGVDTLLLYLMRRLTVARIEQRVERMFGIAGKAFLCPHPEVAMDVDKPHHLDVVRAAWARRQ